MKNLMTTALLAHKYLTKQLMDQKFKHTSIARRNYIKGQP